jgi:hypothetical protein
MYILKILVLEFTKNFANLRITIWRIVYRYSRLIRPSIYEGVSALFDLD